MVQKAYTDRKGVNLYTSHSLHVWIEQKRGFKFYHITISSQKSKLFQAIQLTNSKAFQRKM